VFTFLNFVFFNIGYNISSESGGDASGGAFLEAIAINSLAFILDIVFVFLFKFYNRIKLVYLIVPFFFISNEFSCALVDTSPIYQLLYRSLELKNSFEKYFYMIQLGANALSTLLLFSFLLFKLKTTHSYRHSSKE
jgi:hypothetical protein